MMVDHIVYGVEDLQAGIDDLAWRLGVRAVYGGKHVGRGTHNALLALGGHSYLEIIAIDPDQPNHAGPVAFGLDRIRLPRLVGWATRVTDIEARARQAVQRGYDPGPVQAMNRLRADGTLLEWRLTRHTPDPDMLVLPFMIDWGESEHPSQTLPAGVTLVQLRAEHPNPAAVQPLLAAMDIDLPVDKGPEAALIATLDAPTGHSMLQ